MPDVISKWQRFCVKMPDIMLKTYLNWMSEIIPKWRISFQNYDYLTNMADSLPIWRTFERNGE